MDKAKNPISLKDRRKRIIKLFRWLVFDFFLESTQARFLGKGWVEKRKVTVAVLSVLLLLPSKWVAF